MNIDATRLQNAWQTLCAPFLTRHITFTIQLDMTCSKSHFYEMAREIFIGFSFVDLMLSTARNEKGERKSECELYARANNPMVLCDAFAQICIQSPNRISNSTSSSCKFKSWNWCVRSRFSTLCRCVPFTVKSMESTKIEVKRKRWKVIGKIIFKCKIDFRYSFFYSFFYVIFHRFFSLASLLSRFNFETFWVQRIECRFHFALKSFRFFPLYSHFSSSSIIQ